MRWLGAFWVLPVAVPIWLFYLLPAMCLGLVWPVTRRGLVVEFRVNRKQRWWRNLWSGWGGHAMPFAIVLDTDSRVIRRHELRHCSQWLWFGVLFPLVYGVLLAVYGYHKHPLERDAQEFARRAVS